MHAPIGTHYLLELSDCPRAVLDDAAGIRETVRAAADAANATLIDLRLKRFEGAGVTAIALLAESHLSVHTWPEHGYAAVDIFTCGEQSDPRAACLLLIERLHAGSHHMQMVARGPALRVPSETTSSGRRIVPR